MWKNERKGRDVLSWSQYVPPNPEVVSVDGVGLPTYGVKVCSNRNTRTEKTGFPERSVLLAHHHEVVL